MPKCSEIAEIMFTVSISSTNARFEPSFEPNTVILGKGFQNMLSLSAASFSHVTKTEKKE